MAGTWWWICIRFSRNPTSPFAFPGDTAQAFIDEKIFRAKHLYNPGIPFDPEGMLGSLLTAPISILLGIYFARWINRGPWFYFSTMASAASKPLELKLNVWSQTLFTAWVFYKPITFFLKRIPGGANGTPVMKELWTPPFVTKMYGISLLGWVGCDMLQYFRERAEAKLEARRKLWEKALINFTRRVETFGKNSMTNYFVHTLLILALKSKLGRGTTKSIWSLGNDGLQKLGLRERWRAFILSAITTWLAMEITLQMKNWSNKKDVRAGKRKVA
jgi:predicted acyltransferase